MKHPNNLRTKFKFISDPGHGWLIITPGELRSAGLSAADITPYSYRHATGELIALEEDVDMQVFLRAWEQLIGRPAEIEDAAEGPVFIRDWPRFGTKGATETQVGVA